MFYDYLYKIGASESELVFLAMLGCFSISCRARIAALAYLAGIMALTFFALSFWRMPLVFVFGIPIALMVLWWFFKRFIHTFLPSLEVVDLPGILGWGFYLAGLAAGWYWLRLAYQVDVIQVVHGWLTLP